MNWISFDRQRPKEEPKRVILCIDSNFNPWTDWSDGADQMEEDGVKFWAEIEYPLKPKPDPFEEWRRCGPLYTGAIPAERLEAAMRAAWDAAIKHAKGE